MIARYADGQGEQRMIGPLLLVLSASVILSVSSAVAADTAVAVNPKDRGLILPVGVGEIALGPAWMAGNERRDLEANWNFRYGLSENLELARVGLRYRFFRGLRNEWALSLQNYGLGYDSDHGSYHHTVLQVEGKRESSEILAFTGGIGYFWEDSHEKDGRTHENRFTAGAVFKINKISALAMTCAYRRLAGFRQRSANLLTANFAVNLQNQWDLLLEVRAGDFQEAVDSVLFNESYERLLSLQSVWRF